MKWLAILFSLYVLVLSGISCDAEDDCCNEYATSTQHKPVCPCSPFFSCSTCHGVVVPDTYISVVAVVPVVTPLLCMYKDKPLLDFPALIWQPPRMS